MILLAVGGLAASVASTWVHYRLLRDPTYVSFCDAGSLFNCTEAYTSAYGSVAGVPVALVGVLYFGGVLGLIGLCRASMTARRNLPGYVFVVSTLGLAGVLYFGYISFFVLGTACMLCLAVYAAIIGLVLVSGAAAKEPLGSLPGRATRDLAILTRTPTALAGVVAFIALAATAVVWFPDDGVTLRASGSSTEAGQAAPRDTPAVEGTVLQQLQSYLAQQPRVPVDVDADVAGAAVVIVKFNDYQCPPCKQTYVDYKPIIERYAAEYPGQIAYVTKDFPLDPECNTLTPGGSHTSACEAAVAVRLAREAGRAEAMEEWIFANQATLSPTSVREAARMIAGVTDWQARYDPTLTLVRADITQGSRLGVRGTPTFYMNGMQLPGMRAEFFDAAVAWELARVQSGATP